MSERPPPPQTPVQRPRLAPLYWALFLGVQAVLQTVQVGLFAKLRVVGGNTVSAPALLWFTALTWGLTIGALLHAFWPRPLPGDELGRRGWGRGPQVFRLYAAPLAIVLLFPLLFTLANGNDRPVGANEAEMPTWELLSGAGIYNLEPYPCPDSTRKVAGECLFTTTDGPTLVSKLQEWAQSEGLTLAEGQAWTVKRSGNTVSGKVHMLMPGRRSFLRKTDPVTLEYWGLIYINRQGALTEAERQMEAGMGPLRYHAYAQLRPGHD